MNIKLDHSNTVLSKFVPMVSGLLASVFAGSDLEQLLVSAPLLISVPAFTCLVCVHIPQCPEHARTQLIVHKSIQTIAIATTTCNKL